MCQTHSLTRANAESSPKCYQLQHKHQLSRFFCLSTNLLLQRRWEWSADLCLISCLNMTMHHRHCHRYHPCHQANSMKPCSTPNHLVISSTRHPLVISSTPNHVVINRTSIPPRHQLNAKPLVITSAVPNSNCFDNIAHENTHCN